MRETRAWVFALLMPVACAIAFQAVLPAEYRGGENTDFASFYSPVGHRILAGDGITTESGAVALRYPPGYPLLIAATVGAGNAVGLSEEHALGLLTLVSVAVSSLLLFLIARDLWGGWLALVPSFGFSTYPLGLWLTKQPSSEVPFTALLFSCAYLVWRLTRNVKPPPGVAVAIGALAGAAMLVRPIAVLLPVVIGVLVLLLAVEWSRAQRALMAGVIMLTSAVVITPWELHASHAAGRFVLLSNGGVPSMRDGLTFGVNDAKGRAGIYVPDAVRTVMIAFLAEYDELDSYGAIAKAVGRQTEQHPAGMAGLVSLKLARAWYGTDSQRLDRYIMIFQLFCLSMLGWSMWMAWRAGGERRRLAIIVAAMGVYFWGMSVLALPLVRYMVPAIGLAFLLVPAALERHKV